MHTKLTICALNENPYAGGFEYFATRLYLI